MNSESELRLLSRLDHPSLGLGSGLGLPSGSNSFHPATLFANGEQGAWYDPSDLSTMFQDAAGTIPAVADGAIGLILDKSGRGNHLSQATAAAKPILRQAGGLYYLDFDGVDDCFVTSSEVDLSSSDKLMLWAGMRKTGQATTAGFVETGLAGVGADDGSFLLCAPNVAVTDSYSAFLRGTITTGLQATSYPGTHLGVVSVYFDIAGASRALEIFPRVNGAIPTSLGPVASTDAGSGNFGNHRLQLGARPNGVAFVQFFTGRFYGMVLRGGPASSEQILAGERWLASKTGLTW